MASEPTAAQAAAGNYAKEHRHVLGMRISLENEAGSVRRNKNPDGPQWEQEMAHDYGYIRGTTGRDKDHMDVFLGEGRADPELPVHVIDQHDPETGDFDEHKVMLGFPDASSAMEAYHANYPEGWEGMAAIRAMPLSEFKKWAFKDGRRVKPAHALKRGGLVPKYADGGTVRDAEHPYGELPANMATPYSQDDLVDKELMAKLREPQTQGYSGVNYNAEGFINPKDGLFYAAYGGMNTPATEASDGEVGQLTGFLRNNNAGKGKLDQGDVYSAFTPEGTHLREGVFENDRGHSQTITALMIALGGYFGGGALASAYGGGAGVAGGLGTAGASGVAAPGAAGWGMDLGLEGLAGTGGGMGGTLTGVPGGALSSGAAGGFNAAVDSQLANVAIDSAGGNSLSGYTAAGSGGVTASPVSGSSFTDWLQKQAMDKLKSKAISTGLQQVMGGEPKGGRPVQSTGYSGYGSGYSPWAAQQGWRMADGGAVRGALTRAIEG